MAISAPCDYGAKGVFLRQLLGPWRAILGPSQKFLGPSQKNRPLAMAGDRLWFIQGGPESGRPFCPPRLRGLQVHFCFLYTRVG